MEWWPRTICKNDDETRMDLTVRLSTHDVLIYLNDELGATVLPYVSEALVQRINVEDVKRLAGSPFWWKNHEACLVSVKTFYELVLKSEQEFDLANFTSVLGFDQMISGQIFTDYIADVILNFSCCRFGCSGARF